MRLLFFVNAVPELAEVEYYRKQWAAHEGAIVRLVHLHPEKRVFRGVDTGRLAKELEGAVFSRSKTHGKQMLFVFGERDWVGVHLGMTGQLSVARTDLPVEKHQHFCIDLQSGVRLVFTDPRMFGRILYEHSLHPPRWWESLPPEILGLEFTQKRMSLFLDRRSKAPIKAVLLMQETFPGVGNWMADEILWRARIAPVIPAGKIGTRKRKELYDCIKQVCEDAMRVIACDWSTPPDEWLFNHRWKDGGRCPQTGKPLKREPIGGRTTCWSPLWQTYRG